MPGVTWNSDIGLINIHELRIIHKGVGELPPDWAQPHYATRICGALAGLTSRNLGFEPPP